MKAHLLAAIVVGLTPILEGCATRTEKAERWISKYPAGFRYQLECAELAQRTFHAISDASIRELQTERGSHRIGEMVTVTRDICRRWQSYGTYRVPKSPISPWRYSGLRLSNGLTYATGGWSIPELGHADGHITSSRGRQIFSGREGNERNWHIHPPFSDIMLGDRIADIPSLIGRIRR